MRNFASKGSLLEYDSKNLPKSQMIKIKIDIISVLEKNISLLPYVTVSTPFIKAGEVARITKLTTKDEIK